MKIVRTLGVLVLICAAVVFGYQMFRAWSTVRSAVPPLGAVGQRMLQDLSRESVKESTWLSLSLVPVGDADAAAAALEGGSADAAIVRSDVAMPRNGRTVAVFQTLYAFLIVPPRSTIEDFKGLKDRVVALVPEDPANEKLLDLVLDHYGLMRSSVRRLPMRAEDVGPAMRQRKIAAAFVVGPVGGVPAQTFQSIQKAMKGSPSVLGVEEAEAVSQRANGIDSGEVPKGAFSGSPAQPDEDLTTISVKMRMVVRADMSAMTAGELTRILFETKAKAQGANSQLREMQQPDADEKNYPIHPAAQAYFDGETPTFMDRFESYFWLGSALIGLVGSLFGWVIGKLRRKESVIEMHFNNLMKFMEEVRRANLEELDGLQARVDKAVGLLFDGRADEKIMRTQRQFFQWPSIMRGA